MCISMLEISVNCFLLTKLARGACTSQNFCRGQKGCWEKIAQKLSLELKRFVQSDVVEVVRIVSFSCAHLYGSCHAGSEVA